MVKLAVTPPAQADRRWLERSAFCFLGSEFTRPSAAAEFA
jgi:hypothetical protein